MKCKILVFIFMMIMLMSIFTCSIYAVFSDVPPGAIYTEALDRVSSLKIINGDENGLFRPNSYITREQFAKILVKTLSLENEIENYSGATKFVDVAPDRWSSKYISICVKKNLIKGIYPTIFEPESEVTFAQGCTLVVRALGIPQKNLKGTWPQNFISKAKELGLSDDIHLDASDKLPRWAAALMIDRLWLENIKSTGVIPSDVSKISEEYVILANSTTLDDLNDDQVLTDKGVFYVPEDKIKLQLGRKYKLWVYKNTVLKIDDTMNTVKNVVVDSVTEKTITYKNGDKLNTMVLSENIDYYYKGAKLSYAQLEGCLKLDTSIVFAYNDINTGFDYAVIADPIYSKPEVAINFIPGSSYIGSIWLGGDKKIVKDGKIITSSSIDEGDVIYIVTDIWNKNGYILALSNSVIGKITNILPNKISPTAVSLDGVEYQISKHMDMSKIKGLTAEFKVDDRVAAILGHDGKIVSIVSISDKFGPTTECIILGNSVTSSNLAFNQIATDKGIYFLKDTSTSLELGNTYKFVIDGNTVVKVVEKKKTLKSVVVDKTIGTTITYVSKAGLDTMVLPSGITYYYNGDVVSYNAVLGVFEKNSTIVFADNDTSSGYLYAVIFDPIYSKPEIVPAIYSSKSEKLGDITYKQGVKIVRNSEIISWRDISYKNVVYSITDIYGENEYIRVYDRAFGGTIEAFLPNKIAPTAIKIGATIYEINKYMDVRKITQNSQEYDVGKYIVVTLDRDGKIADIFKD